MSVFNFINEANSNKRKQQDSGSISLASVADLVYEAQQKTQVPQQRTRSSNPGSPFQPERSVFSFIASSPSLSVSKRSPAVSTATSVNSDQQQRVDVSSGRRSSIQAELAFASRSPRKQHAAIAHLSAETAWKRIQAEKEREQSVLQRYYNRRVLVNKQLADLQIQEKELQEALQLSIRNEDYVAAEAARLKRQNIKTKIQELSGQIMEEIDAQIHHSWESLVTLSVQEHEALIKMVEACKSAREEKERNHLQYQIDCDRKHEYALQESSQARSKLEKEKSEIVFDTQMWEQSRQELFAKENDLVQEERTRRKDVVAQIERIQAEIDELQRRLVQLTETREKYQTELAALDESIDVALNRFAPEREALDADYVALEKRKESIVSRSAELDAKDEQLNRQMTLQKEAMDRSHRELQGLDEQMEELSQRIHASEMETCFLSDTFRDLIQARDSLICTKRSTLYKAQEDLDREKRHVQELEQAVYASLCLMDECEESVAHFKTVLAALQRRKQMAVKAGQLQSAAELQTHIKDTEAKLKEAESSVAKQKEQLDADRASLDAAQDECSAMEVRTNKLKEQCTAEIISLLEESRAALVAKIQQEDHHSFRQTLLQLEIESIDLQIKCYGENQDGPSAVQLLSL